MNDKAIGEAFKRTIQEFVPFICPATCTAEDSDQISLAIGVLTNMIGALTMARLVDDPELSERIVEVTRRRLILSVKGVG